MDEKKIRYPEDFDPFHLLQDAGEIDRRRRQQVIPYDPVREEEMARGIFRPV
jgi:hypothetical protein